MVPVLMGWVHVFTSMKVASHNSTANKSGKLGQICNKWQVSTYELARPLFCFAPIATVMCHYFLFCGLFWLAFCSVLHETQLDAQCISISGRLTCFFNPFPCHRNNYFCIQSKSLRHFLFTFTHFTSTHQTVSSYIHKEFGRRHQIHLVVQGAFATSVSTVGPAGRWFSILKCGFP
jgi:hypothetical protein